MDLPPVCLKYATEMCFRGSKILNSNVHGTYVDRSMLGKIMLILL